MRYDKLSGSFGVFDGSVSFKDGLNIICAGNESGKSTACALIRAVLYGIKTSEREKKGLFPDKQKYLPWSGKPMYGRLELSYNNRDITLTRETSKSGPMQGFSAVYTDTNEPAGFISSSNAGETLTGVSQEVFTRSAFCSAESLAVTESSELEKRIEALTGTGDEGVSALAADDILGKWLRERRFNNTGKIPETEREIARLSAELTEVESINAQMLRSKRDIAFLEEKRTELSRRLRRAEVLSAAKKYKKTAEVKKLLESDEAEVNALIDADNLKGKRSDRAYLDDSLRIFKSAEVRRVERDNAEADYKRALAAQRDVLIPPELDVFDGCEPNFALEAAKRDFEESRNLLSSRSKLWIFALAPLFAALGVGLMFVNLTDRLMRSVFSVMSFVLAASAVIWAVLDILKTRAQRRKGEAIYLGYGADSPESIMGTAAKYSGLYNEQRLRSDYAAEKKAALDSAEISLALALKAASERARELSIPENANPIRTAESLLEKLASLDALHNKISRERAALDAFYEAYDLAYLESAAKEAEGLHEEPLSEERERDELSNVTGELRAKELELERLGGSLSRYRDLAELRARLDALLEEKDNMTAQYLAISEARETLKVSSEELSRRLTPALAGRAEEIFTQLTGQKYKRLLLSKDFDAEVMESGGIAARRLLSLSRGAYDQLYLAVRIALSEIIYGGELPPLLLDDVLASFDDERAGFALKFFSREAKKRQIIMFTCRKREIITGEALGANIITKLF